MKYRYAADIGTPVGVRGGINYLQNLVRAMVEMILRPRVSSRGWQSRGPYEVVLILRTLAVFFLERQLWVQKARSLERNSHESKKLTSSRSQEGGSKHLADPSKGRAVVLGPALGAAYGTKIH